MKQENQKFLVNLLIWFGVASLITVGVFALEGFFTDDLGKNLMVLADGFFVSGILVSLFAGLLFVSSQGALLGVGFILRNIVLTWFVPMGRKKQELFGDYRERKMKELKKAFDFAMLIVGLAFLAAGIVFNVIWYVKFYNVPLE